ncbi:MAG: response regulator [Bacteroidota bacterium]|nr:response regulator [Bacteroidota bacterium]
MEDDRYSSILLKEVLHRLHIDVVHLESGQDAVDYFREHPEVDLILMDIKLPDITGYEATAEIRKFNPTVPIIAQTAYALLGDREKALNAGCSDYLSKPIYQKLLKQIIEKFAPDTNQQITPENEVPD